MAIRCMQLLPGEDKILALCFLTVRGKLGSAMWNLRLNKTNFEMARYVNYAYAQHLFFISALNVLEM